MRGGDGGRVVIAAHLYCRTSPFSRGGRSLAISTATHGSGIDRAMTASASSPFPVAPYTMPARIKRRHAEAIRLR